MIRIKRSSAKQNTSNNAGITASANTVRTMPKTLAVAVNKALTVSKQQPYRYLLAATLMSTGSLVHAQSFPATVNLDNLNGSDGFVISGSAGANEMLGSSVSGAGDINGDGIPDLIIGASGASPDGRNGAGSSYVVFGGAGVGNDGSLNISDLDGSNGFVINGDDAGDASGVSVSAAGDFNGDGVDDLIIGAPDADPNGTQDTGESYVVFGGAGVGNGGALALSDLDGSNGFVVKGFARNYGFGTYDSVVSGAGDINGDGLADLIIGSRNAFEDYIYVGGESYVVFGSSEVRSGRTFNLSRLNGDNGFRIQGNNRYDFSGTSVSGAGDVNGDGFDDLVVGATGSYGTRYDSGNSGTSFVIFGGADTGSGGLLRVGMRSDNDLNGDTGFSIFANIGSLESGASVSGAGDVNGDGVDDLIIGGSGGDYDGTRRVRTPGRSFVVFGGSELGSSGSVDLMDNSFLEGSTGFSLIGSDDTEETLYSVSDAGDVNGDGIADVIVGASDRESGSSGSRLSFVVFGGAGVGSNGSVQSSSLDGSNGFVINGFVSEDVSSAFDTEVSNIGDFNSDGVDDVVIGVRGINNSAGQSYVIFGNAETPVPVTPTPPTTPTFDLSQCTIIGTDGPDVLTGTIGRDVICGLGGNDQIRGLGGSDIIFAGAGDDFVSGGAGDDTVLGEDGKDTLVGGSGDDLLDGGELADRLFGSVGNDTLIGGSGADRLFGADGDDTLFGGTGGDRLFSGAGNDFLDGGPFNDTCTATSGINTLENC